jgi:tRNA U34 2-thiouridine synthase MnmA/TrmU
VHVDLPSRTVTVGGRADLLAAEQPVRAWRWSGVAVTTPVEVQVSAHGAAAPAVVEAVDGEGRAVVRWQEPQRRVAAGQSVVAYVADRVVGGGTADQR